MDQQVLVVGAGPVGLTLAATLRRLGLGVRVVDKAPARSDKSKALVLWARTLELLDLQGCVEAFLGEVLRCHGARIVAGGQTLVQLDFSIAETPYNYALMIPQSETERLLEAELGRWGVTVERQVELLDFTDEGDSVAATLRHRDGATESPRCDWLVGCDGAHSRVRHGLGLPFTGVTEPSAWVLADAMIDGPLPAEIVVCWQPDGIAVFFPIASGRFRVIADVVLAQADAPAPTLAEIQALVDQRGPAGLTLHDPIWLSSFRINERKVADYRRDRVFVAGDAAHVHSPAGGQGMNTGMQDAINLGWKLALVAKGLAGERLLDSYSTERSAIGDQVLRNAGTMTRVAILKNPLLQGLRNLAAATLSHLAPVRRRLVDQLSELDLHYESSPLTGQGGGHRAPDLALADGGRLYECLRDGRFLLLAVGQAPPAVPADLAGLVQAAQAAPAGIYAAGHCYLVRPDAYVALATAADRAGAAFDFLRSVSGAA